jgi:hypothetical protein
MSLIIPSDLGNVTVLAEEDFEPTAFVCSAGGLLEPTVYKESGNFLQGNGSQANPLGLIDSSSRQSAIFAGAAGAWQQAAVPAGGFLYRPNGSDLNVSVPFFSDGSRGQASATASGNLPAAGGTLSLPTFAAFSFTNGEECEVRLLVWADLKMAIDTVVGTGQASIFRTFTFSGNLTNVAQNDEIYYNTPNACQLDWRDTFLISNTSVAAGATHNADISAAITNNFGAFNSAVGVKVEQYVWAWFRQ